MCVQGTGSIFIIDSIRQFVPDEHVLARDCVLLSRLRGADCY
jgi:hypothetical protein